MILRVAYDHIVDELRARLPGQPAYIGLVAGLSVVSGGDTAEGFTLYALCRQGTEVARAHLLEAGIEVRTGSWVTPGDLVDVDDEPARYWVATVGYRGRDPKPGVWMDAFPAEPTPAEVLRAIYQEFRETGELVETSFEEFLRLAHPNVVVLGPDEASRYAESKRG
jgi:hypothetical protein